MSKTRCRFGHFLNDVLIGFCIWQRLDVHCSRTGPISKKLHAIDCSRIKNASVVKNTRVSEVIPLAAVVLIPGGEG